MMKVKDLKLSSSFYFADYDKFKSNKYFPILRFFRGLNALALNIQCKSFQYCKAGKIVSYIIFYLLYKKLVVFDILVV